ncbi:cuticle protein 21-like [Ischnura elegans]|uniref:cuticle protein 21-like n=1 Tax=Ischnura elegans TaxID=197161 RepID=UPI001ED8B418|nr:cuticle protein 21-like [Ischnura elegans]
MTASIYALALTFAVAHAGFLGAPATVVTPAFARLATPAYYAYHAPFAYHAPLALAASQTAKPEAAATAPKEPAPAAAPAATTAKPAAAPAKEAAPAEEDADYNPNPSYSFSYDVKDDETGDTKTQSESLENGVVKGSYSVVDPDGVKRTVEYTADAVNGFNAVVNMEPSDIVVKGAKMAAPPATAAAPPATAAAPAKAPSPLAFYHPFAPPLAYHAAVTKVVPAPVTKIVSPQLSYTASHIYHQPTVTYAAAPLHHKVIYA